MSIPHSIPQAVSVHQPDESSPLLHHDQNAIPPPTPTNESPSSIPETHKTLFIVILCASSVLAIDVGIFMQIAPLTRILEGIICHSYYERHPEFVDIGKSIPEEMCKISVVQGELAMLKGWSNLFDCLPALFLAIPFGFVADKYGRKIVVVLATVGTVLGNIWILFVCRFPNLFSVKLIWLAPAFSILGGGAAVASSTILTMVADVVTPSQRSTTFFRITASVLIAQLVAIPLSSILMEYNLWLPMFIGTGAMIFGGLILILLPETLPAKSGPTNSNEDEHCEIEANDAPKLDLLAGLVARSRSMLRNIHSIPISPLMIALILTFLVNSLTRSAVELLLQYASYRYQWTIAQASLFLPLRAAIQLILLLLILPYLSSILIIHKSMDSKTKDLWISRSSAIMLLIGSIGIGISPNPVLMAIFLVIYALGSGFATAVRSLATSLVESHQVARLYAVMTVTDMLGGMLAGPSLSALYAWGLNLGGAWVGLPFVASGLLFLVVAVPLFFSRV